MAAWPPAAPRAKHAFCAPASSMGNTRCCIGQHALLLQQRRQRLVLGMWWGDSLRWRACMWRRHATRAAVQHHAHWRLLTCIAPGCHASLTSSALPYSTSPAHPFPFSSRSACIVVGQGRLPLITFPLCPSKHILHSLTFPRLSSPLAWATSYLYSVLPGQSVAGH